MSSVRLAKTLRHLARTSLKSDSSGHESYEEDVAASAASASDPERALRCKRALDANQRASDALLAESEKAWAMAVLQEFNIMRADRSEQKQAGLATDDLVDLSEIYGFAVTAARKMLAGMPAARDEALEAMKQEQAERPEPKATEFTRAIAKGAGVCDTMVRLWAKMLKASLTGQ